MKKLILNYLIGGVMLWGMTYLFLENNVLVRTNEVYIESIESQRQGYEEILEEWELKYEDLQSSYWSLMTEKEKLEVKLKETELPVYDFTEAQITLIAECVEAEAGIGNSQSQKYITQVILNRLHSGKFPNKVEEVIYEKTQGIPQFSVAYDGSLDKYTTGEVQKETLLNVYDVIVNGTDLPEYVLYFYSAKVEENWVNKLPIYKTVEGTVFAYESKEEY